MLESREVAALENGAQDLLDALLGQGLHELGSPHGRIAQACRRRDGALRIWRMVEQFDVHGASFRLAARESSFAHPFRPY